MRQFGSIGLRASVNPPITKWVVGKIFDLVADFSITRFIFNPHKLRKFICIVFFYLMKNRTLVQI